MLRRWAAVADASPGWRPDRGAHPAGSHGSSISARRGRCRSTGESRCGTVRVGDICFSAPFVRRCLSGSLSLAAEIAQIDEFRPRERGADLAGRTPKRSSGSSLQSERRCCTRRPTRSIWPGTFSQRSSGCFFYCPTDVAPTSHALTRCSRNRRSIGLRARASAARKCSRAVLRLPRRSSSSPSAAE